MTELHARSNRNTFVRYVLLFVVLLIGCVSPANADEGVPPLRFARTGRTLVVSRAQMKYGLERNYLARWVDRPLFQDSSLREDHSGCVTPFSSFRRIMKIARSYDLDGLAFFPETSQRMCIFDYIERDPEPGFKILPEFIGSSDPEKKLALLDRALENPHVLKIGDRILVTGYRTDSLTMPQWKTMLNAFCERHGDAFIFMPDISYPAKQGWLNWSKRFNSEQPPTEEDRETIREYLRSYLDVFDGLYFAGCASLKKQRRFDVDFYREFLIPLYRSVLDEPEYRDKYLGLSACIGHENCTRLGYTLSSDGTKTLRRSLEAALAAEPDLVVLPEWDEQNENTSIRPTVYNSFSTQRILRYYMSRNNGTPPSPIAGDDVSVPNLIISYRKLLTLGETLEVELLHVPDREKGTPYVATFWLEDLNGRRVAETHEFPFSANDLEDHTVRIPSETLENHQVLIPVVQIDRNGRQSIFRDGMHHIHLRATWNWDYKWVKVPLRDVLQPDEASFHVVSDTTNELGDLPMEGSIACGKDIASVEVLENDAVIYSVSPAADSFRERADVIPLLVELRSFQQGNLRGTLRVHNARSIWPVDQPTLMRDCSTEDNSLNFYEIIGWSPRQILLAIRREEAASAVLELDSAAVQSRVSVRTLLKNGIYSETHDDGLTVTFSRFCKQHDMPCHLDRKEVRFSGAVHPDLPTSVFHMRVVAKSGKIYRSRPVLLDDRSDSSVVSLPVYSDTKKKVVEVEVAKRRVPQIEYLMARNRGSVLFTPAGRTFWGHLGGYTDSVTGRGGAGGTDGSPFAQRSNYPMNTHKHAPEWTTEDNSICLRFDGKGNYIALPQGTLPRRGPFSLAFEIKATGDITKPQVLFAHHGYYIGSLKVLLTSGRLSGSFTNEQGKSFRIPTNLQVEKDKWHRVVVSYDLESMLFQLDDRHSPSFTCHGPGLYDNTSVFGGIGGATDESSSAEGNPGWFEGYLRALAIRHNPLR